MCFARLILLLVFSEEENRLTIVKLSTLGGNEAEEEEDRNLPEMLVRIPVTADTTEKS